MRNRLLAAASAVALLSLAPIVAHAGPISGYPAATTPLSGAETVIGTQSGSTVTITAASIAAVITGATSTWTGVQTFPAPGANKGSIVLTPGTISGTPANGSLWTTLGRVRRGQRDDGVPGLGGPRQLPWPAPVQQHRGTRRCQSALTYSGTTLTSTG